MDTRDQALTKLTRLHDESHPTPNWYVSNVSIIFDCSMLLYYPFWMFMGFIFHFYITFVGLFQKWYKIRLFQKKSGKKIITFHETEPPPSHVLHRETRSGVRLGLRRGGSSIFVITNPSPSPIPWCSPSGVSNPFVGSLVSEELDEIHHVIELVLLGLDP